MAQLQKGKKIALIAGIIAVIAIAGYIISVQSNVSPNPVVEEKPSGKIRADVFEEQRDQAIGIARAFTMNAPTFAFDGIPETLNAEYVSIMESYPVQYRIKVTFDSAQAGFGNRTGQMLAQVITPHIMDVIVSEGNVISAVIDEQWDELNHQYVLKNPAVDEQGISEQEAISLIQKQYPELQDFPSDGLPPKIIRSEQSSDGWYVMFETQGSGRPIIEAKCFLVDNQKSITMTGQYTPEADDMKLDISVKTCN